MDYIVRATAANGQVRACLLYTSIQKNFVIFDKFQVGFCVAVIADQRAEGKEQNGHRDKVNAERSDLRIDCLLDERHTGQFRRGIRSGRKYKQHHSCGGADNQCVNENRDCLLYTSCNSSGSGRKTGTVSGIYVSDFQAGRYSADFYVPWCGT